MNMKEKIKQSLILLVSTVALVVLDQIVKGWAVERLKGQAAIALWPGVFELSYVENRGAAFGMLQGQRWLFAVLTVAVILGLIFVYFRLLPERKFRLTRSCCIGVMAGAIGNLIDRIWLQYVVDMFYFKLIDFPVFNVADCYVVVGAFLFCFAAFIQKDLLDDITDRLRGKGRKNNGTEV